MISQKLIDYVKDTHKKGFSFEDIEKALSRAHYTKFEVDEAIRLAREEETLPPILDSRALHHRMNRRLFAFSIGTMLLVLIIFSLFLFTDLKLLQPIDFIAPSVEKPDNVDLQAAFCQNAKIEFFKVEGNPKVCFQSTQSTKTIQVMLRNRGQVGIDSLEFMVEGGGRKGVIQLTELDFVPDGLLAKQVDLKGNYPVIDKITITPMHRLDNTYAKCKEGAISITTPRSC